MGVLIQIDRFNSKNIYRACHSLLKVLSMKKMKYIRSYNENWVGKCPSRGVKQGKYLPNVKNTSLPQCRK